MDATTERFSDSFKAYLCAFSTGDLRVQRHGRKIRVEASSTHPSQIYLVSSLFHRNGRRIEYPIVTHKAFGWRLVYDLSPKFSFLLDSRKRTYQALRRTKSYYFAIAGLIDSEGHIGISAASHSYSPVVMISNSDTLLIRLIVKSLTKRGYHTWIQTRIYSDGTRCYEVCLRGNSAIRLLQRVKLHHPEKIEAKRIAITSENDPREARDAYLKLRTSIHNQKDACVDAAKIAYENRDEKKLRRKTAYNNLAKLAEQMRSNGVSISVIGISLGRSQRTIYRLLRRNLIGQRNSQEGEPAHQ
jgi:hypothetical protein